MLHAVVFSRVVAAIHTDWCMLDRGWVGEVDWASVPIILHTYLWQLTKVLIPTARDGIRTAGAMS
jgi:hypothetical protein